MLRLSSRKLCTHFNGGGEIRSLSQISSFHFGQTSLAPRSFFGVEDFLDDNNSRPYTYKKEKKSKTPNKHVFFKQARSLTWSRSRSTFSFRNVLSLSR
ncbi:hypothetical protein PHJA_002261900 [Phtheirospermum japonicum]|uniref:Uncharacterized protein n=1 Tax=Phtheirospermum japonicum TaxID=374723 RepID=A0A830CQC0_9LAMI|nr:hypothetical protein PHJA_002261900 [Phtheirospermum japonicum]